MGEGKSIYIELMKFGNISELGSQLSDLYFMMDRSNLMGLKELNFNLCKGYIDHGKIEDRIKSQLNNYFGHKVWETTYKISYLEQVQNSVTEKVESTIYLYNTLTSSEENSIPISFENWKGERIKQYIHINSLIEINNCNNERLLQYRQFNMETQNLLEKFKNKHKKNIEIELIQTHKAYLEYLINKNYLKNSRLIIPEIIQKAPTVKKLIL